MVNMHEWVIQRFVYKIYMWLDEELADSMADTYALGWIEEFSFEAMPQAMLIRIEGTGAYMLQRVPKMLSKTSEMK